MGKVTVPQQGTASACISLSQVFPWYLLRGLDLSSMERLGLCSCAAPGEKLGLFPSSALSEKTGCWEHALASRAHPRTFDPLILNPREAMVPQDTSQALPPRQHQEPEGPQRIHLLLACLFLVASRARSPAYPLLRPSFVCLSVCPAGTSC